MRHAVVLLDIEGTTTSISFVYDELFPWIRARLGGWLQRRWDDPDTAALVASLRTLAADDVARGLPVPPIAGDRDGVEAVRDSVVRNVLAQMDADRKTTALKALQGAMWRDGYEQGELRGHLFGDVPSAIVRWRERGQRVCIYSSGSVAAQRLLFGYSVAGDLTPHIEAYFDTTAGPKKEAASYRAIAGVLGVEPADIVFLSDSVDELLAAEDAGCAVVLSVRPGNPECAEGRWTRCGDFRSVD